MNPSGPTRQHGRSAEHSSAAADALDEAIERATDPELREGMQFSLAQVKFRAGRHREALGLFEPLARDYTERYGQQDEQAQLCWYYAAQCRTELGEATAAIEAFGRASAIAPTPDDEDAVSRHLDVLARLMSLYAAMESLPQALEASDRSGRKPPGSGEASGRGWYRLTSIFAAFAKTWASGATLPGGYRPRRPGVAGGLRAAEGLRRP